MDSFIIAHICTGFKYQKVEFRLHFERQAQLFYVQKILASPFERTINPCKDSSTDLLCSSSSLTATICGVQTGPHPPLQRPLRPLP
jgi:hypothetical protein